jgi:aromatic ring-opening dioxygenase catalytic subunit (LigB family)
MIETKGPELVGSLYRLTQHPEYHYAHGSDDHYYPLFIAAGLVDESDKQGKQVAHTWELKKQVQFSICLGRVA